MVNTEDTGLFCKVRVSVGTNTNVPYSQLLDLRSSQTLSERASTEGTAEFLKGLPSRNQNNFSRFQPDSSCKSTSKKTSVYLPTKDNPSEQIITTEKSTILLRYLQQQFDKKKNHSKRENDRAGPSGLVSNPRKRIRVEEDYDI
ncbi:DET1- and DDB1-associated protein 1 [Caerostris darwini]|uniref:DET1- and DDB1-associated protein 1 n=1 Tax=Caerostris darwini TaxID=1538125 RepID=A0AAV4RZ22_9ARAC|nr:DET1- and DDB1-associated protein 1 [Caerostris darwini]